MIKSEKSIYFFLHILLIISPVSSWAPPSVLRPWNHPNLPPPKDVPASVYPFSAAKEAQSTVDIQVQHSKDHHSLLRAVKRNPSHPTLQLLFGSERTVALYVSAQTIGS